MLIDAKNFTLKNYSFTLKSPKSDEAELLLVHLRNVFHESYQNMNHPAHYFDQFPVERETKILRDFAESDSKFLISAYYQNKIIGNLGLFGLEGEFLKHSARIGMGIERKFQNIGLGYEMLKYVKEVSKSKGFHRLELTVRTFNLAGIKLYEKSGFQRIGILKDVAFIDGKYNDEFYYQLIL